MKSGFFCLQPLYCSRLNPKPGCGFVNGNFPREYWGQRPSVILRGNAPVYKDGISTVYLVYFNRVIFEGGAIQYQQVFKADQWPGFFDFLYCQTENSATPLLDVQVKPGIGGFEGIQQLTIQDYRPDDTTAPTYLNRGFPELVAPGTFATTNNGLVPVVAVNCSGVPGCHLDGVQITAAA